jgi:hypothetical protein
MCRLSIIYVSRLPSRIAIEQEKRIYRVGSGLGFEGAERIVKSIQRKYPRAGAMLGRRPTHAGADHAIACEIDGDLVSNGNVEPSLSH